MIKRIILAVSTLLLFCASLCFAGDPASQEVELMHFWKSPKEKAAVAVLQKALADNGITLLTDELENNAALQLALNHRLLREIPPTFFQWRGGNQLFYLAHSGFINVLPLNSSTGGQATLPIVRSLVASGAGWTAIPLGLHIDNWIWFNTDIYEKLNLPIPTTLSALVNQFPAIKAGGYIPVALGQERWQRTILYEGILAGVFPLDKYKLFIKSAKIDFIYTPEFATSIELLKKIYSNASKAEDVKTWDDATNLVKSGDAALQFMGDWAKQVLIGSAYTGKISSSRDGAVCITLDVLAFSKIDDAATKALQEQIARIFLSKSVQADYNYAKGSLPVRSDIDLSHFDSLAQTAYARFKNPAHMVSDRLQTNDSCAQIVLGVVCDLVWENNNISIEEVIKHLEKISADIYAQ